MKVNFFSEPYLLYEGSLKTNALIIMETCIGFVYSDRHSLSFPVFIYDCLHEYDKDWI
jgi:hypothetical protein